MFLHCGGVGCEHALPGKSKNFLLLSIFYLQHLWLAMISLMLLLVCTYTRLSGTVRVSL
jgi:hypothetical protein